MANRRMYAKSVIDTDKFMEMPISTQCLYFHLLLRGDDDGFVASPKLIMRQLRASEDDMKILIAKEYVIAFDSGVIVIRDWFVHNQLRHDRYTPTAHTEKSLLVLNKDKTYRFMPSDVHPSGNQAATIGCQSDTQIGNHAGNQTGNQRVPQVRLGKVSIGKYSIDKYRVGEERREQSDDVTTTPCHEILSLYHALCPSFRPAKVLTARRIAAMEALYATLGKSMEAIKEYFQRCADTPFLCGENRMGWAANLDFLLDPSKYENIIAGKYDDDWRDTDGGHGAGVEHSGRTEGKKSSLGADYEAFEKRQKLPGEL
ncbi:MAG: hypothetical protein J6O13_00810 [Selenomonas sp.]|nr:hypothetical protein [Selenomonas sp.]